MTRTETALAAARALVELWEIEDDAYDLIEPRLDTLRAALRDLDAGAGEPRWFPENDPPINPGWYAVQRKDGSLCLRAFGNGEWWIPLADGWLSGLPTGFRWLGPLEPVEWDTPRTALSPSPSAAPKEEP